MMNCKNIIIVGITSILLSGLSDADIIFKKGWDSADNSDVQDHVKNTATAALAEHDSLEEMINASSKCRLEVTKGCHQANDPHFTVNGLKSKNTCKLIMAGSKSIHVPCS